MMGEITKGLAERLKIVQVQILTPVNLNDLLDLHFILRFPWNNLNYEVHGYVSVSSNYEYHSRSYCGHLAKLSDDARKLLQKRLEKVSEQLIREL
jgi:hypothetical protein